MYLVHQSVLSSVACICLSSQYLVQWIGHGSVDRTWFSGLYLVQWTVLSLVECTCLSSQYLVQWIGHGSVDST